MQTASSPGVTPVLLSSHQQTETSPGEPLRGSGHLWEPGLSHSCSLRLGLSVALASGQQHLRETFSDGDTSTFPKSGVNDVDKLTELAAATLWDLRPDFRGLYEGLDSPGTCAHGIS